MSLYSAASIQAERLEFKKQLLWVVLGLPGFFLFLLADPRLWGYYSRAIYAGLLLILGMVLIPGLGKSGGGAQRWLDLGPFQLQPSELAKLFIIFVLADFLARLGPKLRTPLGLLASLAYVLVPFLLVIIQPNLSMSLVFLAIWAGMSLVAGQRVRFMLVVALGCALAFSVAWQSGVIRPYQKKRVLEYFSGDAGFHTERSLIAVGSGGPVGQGFGRGPFKEARFVPEATTDFIFTVIGEEGGFIGSALVVLAFAFFLWRVWLVAVFADVRFFRYVAAGIFVVFSFHTLVNLLVIVRVLPVTGMPLPFISYGGSAMLMNLAALGLLINIRGREKHLVF